MNTTTTIISQENLSASREACQQIKEYWLSQGRTPWAFVDTYGRQQNEADSERIQRNAPGGGLQPDKPGGGRRRDCSQHLRCPGTRRATGLWKCGGLNPHSSAAIRVRKIFLCGCMMGPGACSQPD